MGWWIIIGGILFLGLATYIGALLSGDDKEDAAAAGVTVSLGCLYVIAQLLASAAVIWILWLIGKWMFG